MSVTAPDGGQPTNFDDVREGYEHDKGLAQDQNKVDMIGFVNAGQLPPATQKLSAKL
jgi:hypothetical protein